MKEMMAKQGLFYYQYCSWSYLWLSILFLAVADLPEEGAHHQLGQNTGLRWKIFLHVSTGRCVIA